MPSPKGYFDASTRIVADKELRVLAISFGKIVDKLAIEPQFAAHNIRAIREIVKRNFGDVKYDPSTFPIQVTPDKKSNTIEVVFPIPVSILVANPEIFLVWADKLEEAAKVLLQSTSN